MVGDHTIAQRTEMSEASSLNFNLSDMNQNRRSIVHDIYQKCNVIKEKTRRRPTQFETVAVSAVC